MLNTLKQVIPNLEFKDIITLSYCPFELKFRGSIWIGIQQYEKLFTLKDVIGKTRYKHMYLSCDGHEQFFETDPEFINILKELFKFHEMSMKQLLLTNYGNNN